MASAKSLISDLSELINDIDGKGTELVEDFYRLEDPEGENKEERNDCFNEALEAIKGVVTDLKEQVDKAVEVAAQLEEK